MASAALTFDLISKRISTRTVPATITVTAVGVGSQATGVASVLGRSASVGGLPIIGYAFGTASATGRGASTAQAVGSAAGTAVTVSPGFAVPSPISGLQGAFLDDNRLGPNDAFVNLNLYSDGTYIVAGSQGDIASGNWGTPPTPNKGAEYWVKFTRTLNPGTGGSTTATTDWLQLSATRTISALVTNDVFGLGDATYDIELSTSASGSPVVSTTTGVRLYALVET